MAEENKNENEDVKDIVDETETGADNDTGSTDGTGGTKPDEEDSSSSTDEVDDQEVDEDAELDTSVWGDPGDDEVVKSVLQVMQNSGVAPETAKALLFDAYQQSDPSLVDRDALVEAVGKTKATLVMSGIENVTKTNKAAIQERLETVRTAVGGKDNWDKVIAWAKKNVSEKDLNDYAFLIDEGGAKARFAAKEMADQYNADKNNTSLNAGQSEMEGEGKGGSSIRGITRLEYGLALQKLHKTRQASPAALETLRAQRKAGKAKGI